MEGNFRAALFAYLLVVVLKNLDYFSLYCILLVL